MNKADSPFKGSLSPGKKVINKDRAMRILKKIRSGQFKFHSPSKYSPRGEVRKIKNQFTTEKLMMLLNKEKLRALESEFERNPEGLELVNFVRLMKSAISYSREDEYDVVYGLCQLFSEIDINGDEHMEWSEFT